MLRLYKFNLISIRRDLNKTNNLLLQRTNLIRYPVTKLRRRSEINKYFILNIEYRSTI